MDKQEMTVKVGDCNAPLLDFIKVVFDSIIGDINLNIKGVEGWLLNFKVITV
jgi:hypothetical protein